MKNLNYISCLFFILLSCNPAGTQRVSQAPDTLQYHYTTFTRYSEHVVDDDGRKDTTYFKASYPVFEDQQINRLVAKQFTAYQQADTPYRSIEAEAKAFIEEYDDFIKTDEYPRAWQAELQAKIIQNIPNYLALAVETSDYTGGAHGNYATLFSNYDVVKKDTLGLRDIIPPAKLPVLTGIAEKIFREQEGLTPRQSLSEGYFFEDNTFYLNTNFTLTPDGLLFLYNIYEINAYAAGTTELLIPYDQIDSLMTGEGKRISKQLRP